MPTSARCDSLEVTGARDLVEGPAEGGRPFPTHPAVPLPGGHDRPEMPPDVEAIPAGSPLGDLAREAFVGPPPITVTREWLSQWVTSRPAEMRHLHQSVVRGRVLLFPPIREVWPGKGEEPDHERLVSLAWTALHFAGGMFVNGKPKSRRGFMHGLFSPFYGQMVDVIAKASRARRHSTSSAPNAGAISEILREEGNDDLFRFSMVLGTASAPPGDDGHTSDEDERSLCHVPDDLRDYTRRVSATSRTLMAALDRYSAAIRSPDPRAPVPAQGDLGGAGGLPDDPDLLGITGGERIRVPAFVDGDWLRDKVSLAGHVRSVLHARGDAVRALTGASGAWPAERPDTADVPRLLASLLGDPLALADVCLAMGGPRAASVFKPFYKGLEAQVRTDLARTGLHVDVERLRDEALLRLSATHAPAQAATFALLRGAERLDDEILHAWRRDCLGWDRSVTDCLVDRKRVLHRMLNDDGIPETMRHLVRSRPTDGADAADRDGDVTGIPVSDDGGTSPVIPDGAVDAPPLRDYADALEAMLAQALAARDAAPSQEGVRRLREALDAVQAACDGYEAWRESQPKGVGAEGLRGRLASLRAVLGTLAEELEHADPIADVPEVALVREDAFEGLGSAVAEGEAALAETVARRDASTGLAASLGAARLAGRQAILMAIMESDALVQDGFSRALAGYGSATRLLREGAFAGPALPTRAVAPTTGAAAGTGTAPIVGDRASTEAAVVGATPAVAPGPATVAGPLAAPGPEPVGEASHGCVADASPSEDEAMAGPTATEPASEPEADDGTVCVAPGDIDSLAGLARDVVPAPVPPEADGDDGDVAAMDAVVRRLVAGASTASRTTTRPPPRACSHAPGSA